MKKELGKLYKETNKSIKKDYKSHREHIITRNLDKYRSTKRGFKELKISRQWIQKLSKDLEETKTRKDVINHATKFYKDLYKRRDVDKKLQSTNQNYDWKYDQKTNSVNPIDEREVYEHIKRLKNEKCPGPDGISNEAIKLGAPILLHHLTQLF